MRFAALALLLALPCAAPPIASAAAAARAAERAATRGATREAEPDTYIFDLLALQPYKGNFARLVKDGAAPDWVRAIAVQGAGTSGPGRTVDVAGTPYRLDRVCKVGASCATDRVDVLWAPRGARVWAALVEDGRAPAMLGDPKGPQLKALAEAAGGAPPPAAPPAAQPAAAAASGTAASPAAAAAVPPSPAAPAAPAAPTPATSAAASPAAEPNPYIFDVLALQPYKGNFARLIRGKGTPGWVTAIAVQGAGAAGPMRTVDVAGTRYRLDRVCRVGTSCATDRIDVLWAPRGARVWAALVEDGKAPAMLGDPKGPQAEALAGAASAPPPAASR